MLFSSLLGSAVYLLFVLEITEFNGLLVGRIIGEAVYTAALAPLVFRMLAPRKSAMSKGRSRKRWDDY